MLLLLHLSWRHILIWHFMKSLVSLSLYSEPWSKDEPKLSQTSWKHCCPHLSITWILLLFSLTESPLLLPPLPPTPPCFVCQESFVRAKNWVKELQRQASPNIVIALAGNKADLANKRALDFQVCVLQTLLNELPDVVSASAEGYMNHSLIIIYNGCWQNNRVSVWWALILSSSLNLPALLPPCLHFCEVL